MMRWMLAVALAVIVLPCTTQAATCEVALSNGMVFGKYYPIEGRSVLGQGEIHLHCTGQGRVSVALGPGNGGRYNPRTMDGSPGPGRLSYRLYTDAARTWAWGDGTAGTQTVVRTFDDERFTLYVYGEIPAGQIKAAPGQYSDRVTVTVFY